MAVIEKSKLLVQLLARAQELEETNETVCTPEAFLCAVCEFLAGELPLEGTDEDFKAELKAVFEVRGISVEEVRKRAYTCLTSREEIDFSTALYMQQRIIDAKLLLNGGKKNILTPQLLLECVLSVPPEGFGDVIPSEKLKPKARLYEAPVKKEEESPESGDDGELQIKKFRGSGSAQKKEAPKPEKPQQSGDDIPLTKFGAGAAPKEPVKASGKAPEKAPEKEPEVPADPKERITELTERVKKTREILRNVVKGQEHAISVFTGGYFQAEIAAMTQKERNRPLATFLFAGPPGVGKSFLATVAAGKECLDWKCKVFDMSEYSNHEAAIEFIGSDEVYKGSKKGNFTAFVEENPKSILIFDEIEKADISIIHLFLQILDFGRIRDSHTDKELSLTDTILIFTTNAGRQLYEASDSTDFSGLSNKVILNAIRKEKDPTTGQPFFPDAICSRFAMGNVVMFNHLPANALCDIVKGAMTKSAKSYEEGIGVQLDIGEEVYPALMFAEGGAADGRTMRSRATSFIDKEIFELLRLVSSGTTPHNVKDIEKIGVRVELPQDDPTVYSMFVPDEVPRVLVFTSVQNGAQCSSMASGYEVVAAQTVDEGMDALRNQDIKTVLIDMRFGQDSNVERYLNTEDIRSVARDFFRAVREQYEEMPLYLLETSQTEKLDDEELVSFVRAGVRGTVDMTDAQNFNSDVQAICSAVHQQNSMRFLARANKVLRYGTAQRTAVDAEDSGSILSNVSKPDETFKKVIGAEDAKKELQFFVNYLKNPKKYLATGMKAPKGVILYGPPGTGKTMLAKAMACESDVTFIATAGNEFLQKYVGEGKEKVNELFRTARKYAPSIIFVDEIDAIAKERKGEDGHGEDVLTAFLAQMDGFYSDPSKPVFVLAATNFEVEPGSPKSLDEALMRRFDRKIYVDLPNREERLRFLRETMEKNALFAVSENALNNIALRSTGMSLAILANVCELALRMTVQDDLPAVTDDVFLDAFETSKSGEVKEWDDKSLLSTARHEAGHAYLYWKAGNTPSYLTIVARGNYGGYMQHDDDEDKFGYTKEELLGMIRCSLGGRAAELVYYGEKDGVTTGASSDLRHATALAQHMLCDLGMDDDFGLAAVMSDADYSALSGEIRRKVNAILSEQMERSIREIKEGRSKIDALVEALMEKNHLTGSEIVAILEEN